MEEYERRQNDERLVKLINHVDECSKSSNIVEWLDSVPEISEICIFLRKETREEKYKDILVTILTSIDEILVDVIQSATIGEKEKFNVVRLRLFHLMSKVD